MEIKAVWLQSWRASVLLFHFHRYHLFVPWLLAFCIFLIASVSMLDSFIFFIVKWTLLTVLHLNYFLVEYPSFLIVLAYTVFLPYVWMLLNFNCARPSFLLHIDYLLSQKCPFIWSIYCHILCLISELEKNLACCWMKSMSQKSAAEELIDKELPLKFVEVDEEQSRLVLSNRKAMADSQAQLGIGSVVVGTVQSLKPYGAFIDIGGINGLLHVSQISHDRVSDISTVLQPGDSLKVFDQLSLYRYPPPHHHHMIPIHR